MSVVQEQTSKVRRQYLFAAYCIAAAGFGFAVWRGWFTANSIFTTEVAPATILVLAFATTLARGPMAVLRAPPVPLRRALMNVLKIVACFVFAMVWVVALARRVPNSNVGAVLLFVPPLGAILWGGFYFLQASRFVTRRILRALLLPRSSPEPSDNQESASPVFRNGPPLCFAELDFGSRTQIRQRGRNRRISDGR